MTTRSTTGTQWREMLGQAITTTCPHAPAWAVYELRGIDMAILITSVVLVQHTTANVAGERRIVRGHRRVAVGLS